MRGYPSSLNIKLKWHVNVQNAIFFVTGWNINVLAIQ